MTPLTLNSLTPEAQNADGLGPNGVAGVEATPEQIQVAQQFEAIFLRKMLSALEKSGTVGGDPGVGSGSSIFGSMVVGSVADSAAGNGGIGLAEVILESLVRAQATRKTSESNSSSNG